MSEQAYEQLAFSAGDSHASHSVLPGSAEARRMTATSGQKCCALLKNCGPVGSLVRMLLESSIWHSTRCYLTWKPKATPQGRLLFQLAPSTPRTEETEYVSWAGNEERPIYFIPTPRAENLPTSEKAKREYGSSPGLVDYVKMVPQSWPTPVAADAHTGKMASSQQKPGSRHSVGQADAVMMWPTPKARDYRSATGMENRDNPDLNVVVKMWPTPRANSGTGGSDAPNRQGAPDLQSVVKLIPTPTTQEAKNPATYPSQANRNNLSGHLMRGGESGQLNPAWVEAMMGFPNGWTELED